MATPETVRQILDAAGEIFAEKGFDRTTVREVSSKAGVNLAAVNYHFGDKERLYIQAVKDARNVLEAAVPLPDDFDVSEPEEALKAFIRTITGRILNTSVASWRHRLLVREFMNPTRACEEMVQESILPFLDHLLLVIRKIMHCETPDYRIRQIAFSIISQCAYYRLQDRVVSMLTPPAEFEQHFTPEELSEHISQFSLAAIRAYDTANSFNSTRIDSP